MEFTVDAINEEGLVVGKNGNVDIPLGTIFTKITKYKIEGDAQNLKIIEFGETESIDLSLFRVNFFRSEVDAVPRGHTAGLLLEGEGIALLKNVLRESRWRVCTYPSLTSHGFRKN